MAHILVIDDSAVIRELLLEYLTDNGHEVELASDGQIGIDLALEKDFDIILCDIHMPRKNGYQVFSEVSTSKPSANFIVTDSLPDHLAEMAQRDGAYTCLIKPFDLDEVKSTISAILKHEKQHE